MKIAMMTAWNTDSGVAVHAEPIAKAWMEKGHEVTIFSFVKEDFHGDGFTGKDEEYVIRCFGTPRTNKLDPRPILKRRFDIFVVEDLRMLPYEQLAKIFPLIKRQSPTVHIVHECSLPDEPWFYQFDWDKVVYFDERQRFLKEVYPDATYIPFPCFRLRRGEKQEARRRLGLPLDKKIIYCFAQRGYHSYLRDLPEELEKRYVLLHLLSSEYEMLEEVSPPPWMIIRREEVLSRERFDDYLFASDAVILHKFKSRRRAVVSSTAFQALGAGCPIFVPKKSDFFYPLKDEVIRYGEVDELIEGLVELFENEERRRLVLKKAEDFVVSHSPERIADRFIEVFAEILKGR